MKAFCLFLDAGKDHASLHMCLQLGCLPWHCMQADLPNPSNIQHCFVLCTAETHLCEGKDYIIPVKSDKSSDKRTPVVVSGLLRGLQTAGSIEHWPPPNEGDWAAEYASGLLVRHIGMKGEVVHTPAGCLNQGR